MESSSVHMADGCDGGVPASLECGVCCGLVADNRACPQCRKLFCGACISKWFESRKHDDQRVCPMCRCPASLSLYAHDDVRQALADSQEAECDFKCGYVVRWGDRERHYEECELLLLPCPYRGCHAFTPRRDFDLHVYDCNFRLQYAEAGNEPTAEASSPAAKFNPADAEDEDPKKAVRKTTVVVHLVRETDTLSGLAIKYGCASVDIRRLNRLPTENIHGHMRLLIPADPQLAAASEPTEADDAVLEALRRRRCIREFMRIAKVREACEAIAYLNLCDYDLNAAIAKHAEDEVWAHANPNARKNNDASRRNGKRPMPPRSQMPSTLSEFIDGLRGRARPMACHGCLADHSPADSRVHCSCCGLIFCSRCGPVLCDGRVSKRALGVTAPGAGDALVRACNRCVDAYGGRGATVCVGGPGDRRVVTDA
eukprot:Opistho-2@58455